VTKDQAFIAGYLQAKQDCLRVLAKWFFMSKKDAKACRDEMLKLYATKLK